MISTSCNFKPVSFVLLVFLAFLTVQPAGRAEVATEDYFTFSTLPSLPQTAPVQGAWRFVGGLAVVQQDKLLLLPDGAEGWGETGPESAGIAPTAITVASDGKLYIVDGAKVSTLEIVEGKVTRTDLYDLPVVVRDGDAEVVDGTLYVAGIDARGNNVFLCGTEQMEAWGTKNARRVLTAMSQGHIYVFSEEEGSSGMSAYVYNPHNGDWKELGDSGGELALKADEAFACGDAHILFLGSRGGDTLAGFYSTQKRWVQFDNVSLPSTDFALVSDYKSFTVITSQSIQQAEAVFPGTKYGIWDHLIVAAFFILMLWMGKYFSKREKSENDFFRGGQRLPWWAVGLSMFATGASAISLMAMPAKAYTENWIYFLSGPLQILFLPFVFIITIPIVRRLNFPTAYQYLEARYCRSIRVFGSVAFCAAQILGRMAAIMLLPSIALSAICGIPIEISILVMGLVTTLYCMMGGFEAVVWTDCIQAFVMLAAMILCVVWVFVSLDVPGSDAWTLVMSEQKLVLADFSWDITKPIIYIVLLGSVLAVLGGIGDQNFIQRVQALPSEKEARKAVVTQLFVAVPLNACLFGLGTCLFVYYHFNADKISPAMKADGIFPLFAAQTLPTGLAGIVVAALMAATMSTLSSALNSVSNVVVEDYVRNLKKDLTDHQALIWGKVMTVVLGVVGTSLSLWLARANSTSIWDMTMVIMGVVFAPLGSMFLMGVLTRRVHTGGILCGFVAGITATLYCKYNVTLHPFFFGPIGLLPSMVVAYVVSVIFPRRKPRDLTGLTIFSLPPKKEMS